MTHRSYKTESRVDWGTSSDGLLNIEQINCGAILRIADAVEKMAASYDQMRNARDYWERRAKENQATADRLARSNAALRGVIARAKRKAEQSA